MPGRIEGYADALAGVAATSPLWKVKLQQLAEKLGLREASPAEKPKTKT